MRWGLWWIRDCGRHDLLSKKAVPSHRQPVPAIRAARYQSRNAQMKPAVAPTNKTTNKSWISTRTFGMAR